MPPQVFIGFSYLISLKTSKKIFPTQDTGGRHIIQTHLNKCVLGIKRFIKSTYHVFCCFHTSDQRRSSLIIFNVLTSKMSIDVNIIYILLI